MIGWMDYNNIYTLKKLYNWKNVLQIINPGIHISPIESRVTIL